LNIFFRELRANLKSLVIWCVILILLVVVGAAKFTAYYNDPSMLAILNAFPKAVVDALELTTFNLTTVTGFYGLMMIYYALMGGIAAAMWGSDSISKEERDKTVEFSLVLPVSRGRVITGKLLAALVNCIVFVLVTWGVSLVAAQQFHPDQAFNRFLALEMAGMLFIELIFLAIGLFLGCAMKQYKSSGSIAIAIILVTYFLSVLSGMQANLDFLKYFTPFKYFDAGVLLQSGKLDPMYMLLSATIIIVCVIVAYWVYNKRDLYI
jgi:ABC-2 type transport system permease protein